MQYMAVQHAALRSQRSGYLGNRLGLQIGQQICMRRQPSGRGPLVQASFFGVGAPEAVLVGLVALVIFGPQGLAEAAKTAGRTIRAFKPTFDELTTVSKDLRNTLDQELGINEIRKEFSSVGSSFSSPARGSQQPDWNNLGTSPNTNSDSASTASSRDDAAADPDIETKRARSAELAWGKATQSQDTPASENPLSDLSLEELRAELARRRATKKEA